MNWERITYTFFTLMSLTTVAGFVYLNDAVILFIAAGFNLMSTFLKIGIKNALSAQMLASSLVSDLHLIPAFLAMVIFDSTTTAVALSVGALVANLVSVVFVIIESTKNNDDI
ncbi:MAG: Unknown protein [uncultured Campylobacterales bacterium]|uniref:Integral membrane protein n=1 Tax=uncultured Campylobacterales bacterium TaxID=352960 RepID=A0A6S6T8Q9_9BACT|nr:MAG: Unknown protein [uncultured Campylobacterales bacterium]